MALLLSSIACYATILAGSSLCDWILSSRGQDLLWIMGCPGIVLWPLNVQKTIKCLEICRIPGDTGVVFSG